MMSEYILEQWAKHNPLKLKRILLESEDVYTLTYGLEILGECSDLDIPDIFLKFLSHSNPVVVEGCLYGIEKYYVKSFPKNDLRWFDSKKYN